MPPSQDLGRFEQAVLPHLDAAYNLARWLTRDGTDAQDVVQEAVMRAWRFFAACKGDARPWLLRIVRNTAWTWLAKQRGGVVVPFAALGQEEERALLETVPTQDDDPEAVLRGVEERRLMDALIERLPPAFRECLVLRELEELSYREIAEVVEAPIGTVMSRLARARALLQAMAAEEAAHAL